MENNFWNNKNISLDKSLLSTKEVKDNLNTQEIRSVTKNNEKEARELLLSFPNVDKEVVSFFESNALVDGSVNISNVQLESKFFKKEESYFIDKEKTITRGYDYVCSLDNSLTSIQKIKKYKETIHEVVESLKENNLNKIEKLLLLDYLKNSLITILNSFVYQEKLGLQNTDKSKEYEMIRSGLILNTEDVINCSVDFILNKELKEIHTIDFGNILSSVDNAVTKLTNYHLEYKLPSFYVSRPEATHPLAIIGASLLCAKRYSGVDVVVGVPSGGTEFAFTVKIFLNKLENSHAKLVLLPVSFHSFKQSFNEDTQTLLNPSIKKYFGNEIKSILICDDNTSTGKTLQLLKDKILEVNSDIEINCAVAEADIIRSQIDIDNKNRTHIANKNIYTSSVNILPVSKNINPKTDLKEIIENRKIISYYKNMEEKSLNVIDQIYAKVMAHVNEFGVDYSNFTQENAVLNFHGTFLSNFYATPIELNGKTYPSVEHAYQASKFLTVDWSNIQQETKDEIKELLKLKGYSAQIIYGDELFIDEKMTAGNIKTIADVLRKYGYADKEWEDKRVKIMINILLQKFKSEEMKIKLRETNGKELIEGNDWNDTLWGVCDGSGRNILGIILMEIRNQAE